MHVISRQSGFTLIEMLVSLSLFTIIITITVGTLLVLLNSNRELASSQSLMDTLSFSLDSMTREIRTGRQYFCGSTNNMNAPVGGYRMFRESAPVFFLPRHEEIGSNVRDCPTGRGNNRFHGVSIIESDNSVTGSSNTRILYYYDDGGVNAPGRLMRRIGNNPAESILSSNIDVVDANFFVSGTERLAGGGSDDTEQPTVTVLIEATAVNNPTDIITLQTTVTQRELDI